LSAHGIDVVIEFKHHASFSASLSIKPRRFPQRSHVGPH
jgi:hypothetical protein